MGETATNSVLGRIAAAGREERKARAMTLPKALRLCMAKVADALMDLPIAVIGAVIDHIDGDQIETLFKEDALLMLLDGPDGYAGAAVFEPTVVGGLIQQQTMGAVQADTGTERKMTRTDAAICAPLIDHLFERVCPMLDDPEDIALIEGFRFGAKAEDARTLAIALDAQSYAIVRLTVDIARGARQGELFFVLPMPDARDTAFSDAEEDEAADSPTMTDTVMNLNTDLQMVLCRLHLPFSALQALSEGDELPLTPDAFPNVQITTNTGRVVGLGVVGHVDGVRAVKPQRKPNHATQPLRRESDEPMVDMPRVEQIAGTNRRSEDQDDVGEAEIEAAMADLPPLDLPMDIAKEPADVPDVQLPAVTDLPDLDDLPDLSELPDLADLPDLSDLEVEAAG